MGDLASLEHRHDEGVEFDDARVRLATEHGLFQNLGARPHENVPAGSAPAAKQE